MLQNDLKNRGLERGWFPHTKTEGWSIWVTKVHDVQYIVTFTRAIFFMIFTQDEVLTCRLWVSDCEGASKINIDGLGDEGDGFFLW